MRRAKERFAVCVRNDGVPASLQLRKLYQVLPDLAAAEHNQVRIIDESGEDYLYPESYFVPVNLPKSIENAVLRAS